MVYLFKLKKDGWKYMGAVDSVEIAEHNCRQAATNGFVYDYIAW